jgi:hypothetical protein
MIACGLRTRASWALVLALMSCAEGEARAQSLTPRDSARALANQAADAIARGDYAEGEALLGRAFQQFPAPTIALLHARTLVRLGRLADAVDAYQRASLSMLTADAPEAFRSATASARLELATLVPRVPRLQVNVRAAGSGSQRVLLRLDGKSLPASQLGRWFLVDPGRRVVRIDWNGASYERILRIDEGQSVVTEVVEPRTSPATRGITLGALGVGALGIGTGIVTGLIATAAHGQAREGCPNGVCVSGSEGARDLERYRDQRVVSTVSYAVGAACLGLGGILLLRGSFDEPRLQLELEPRNAGPLVLRP